MDAERRQTRAVRWATWATATAMVALVAGCGATDAPSGSGAATSIGDSEVGATSAIDIVVVLPVDWPNPIYGEAPDVVVTGTDDEEHRSGAVDDRVTVRLPSSGRYSVGAVVEDGGCSDTAGVSQYGNPPIDVADGDIVELQDTGELCD